MKCSIEVIQLGGKKEVYKNCQIADLHLILNAFIKGEIKQFTALSK